jgi:hypothetical protein
MNFKTKDILPKYLPWSLSASDTFSPADMMSLIRLVVSGIGEAMKNELNLFKTLMPLVRKNLLTTPPRSGLLVHSQIVG